jgi:hypothetical protein
MFIKGTAVGLIQQPDSRDKETGEIKQGSHQLEMMVKIKLKNGEMKTEIQSIKIPESKVKEFELQIGKEIQVACSYWSKTPVYFKLD